MKLTGYRCKECEHEVEEIFLDTETPPDLLDTKCPKCGGFMEKWNFKKNPHRYYYADREL